MADDGEPRKRSRFDQTSAEPAKKSRFDRRSRSPAREEAEAKRSRSPASKAGDDDVQSPGAKAKRDAMKAAEEAAARINASLKAKTSVQKVDVPPIRSVGHVASVVVIPSGYNADVLEGFRRSIESGRRPITVR